MMSGVRASVGSLVLGALLLGWVSLGCQRRPLAPKLAVPRIAARSAAGLSEVIPSSGAGASRSIPAEPLLFRSLPSAETLLHRVSFGSCSLQYQEQPIWSVIEESDPDVFLHLGDMIYADRLPFGDRAIPTGMDVVAKARVDYAFLSAQPSFAAFVAKVPFLSVWDDHDLGENDAGASFPHLEAMRNLYLEFVAAGSADPRRSHRGLYFGQSFGPPGRRVQILLVDTRTFRDDLARDPRSAEEKRAARVIGTYAPHSDPKKTLLGEEQWRWLEERLAEPADVRIIASSIQVVASEKGIESWGNFPHERAKFYDLIEKTRASGVLLLSGDVHFAELSKTLDGPYPLYDFTSSNLAQHEKSWAESVVNRYRVLGPYSRVNFGQIDLDWEKRAVTLKAKDSEGKIAFEKEILLEELEVR